MFAKLVSCLQRRSAWMGGAGLLMAAAIWGLSHSAPAPSAPAQAGSPPATPELSLSPSAIRNAQIRLAIAGPARLEQSSMFPGRIAVDEHRQQAVSAHFSGVLTSMPLHAGEQVRQGDLLALLESRELAELRLTALQRRKALDQARRLKDQEAALQQRVHRLIALLRSGADFDQLERQVLQLPIGTDKGQLLEIYSRLKLSNRQLAREQQLFREHISSEQEYQQARQRYEADLSTYSASLEEVARQHENLAQARRLDYDLAAAGLDNSLQQLRALGDTADLNQQPLTRYVIRAPRSGTLIEKRAAEGEEVSPASVLYVIADLSAVWAEMQIFENDLTGVKVGMPVTIRSEDGKHHTAGQLAHLRPIVDEISRTAEAHAEIANPDRVWFPGMYVTLQVIRSQSAVPVAVETAAIQQIDNQPTVFVRTATGFVPRRVKTGRRGDKVEILSGLRAGERYAAANSFVLKSALLGQE